MFYTLTSISTCLLILCLIAALVILAIKDRMSKDSRIIAGRAIGITTVSIGILQLIIIIAYMLKLGDCDVVTNFCRYCVCWPCAVCRRGYAHIKAKTTISLFKKMTTENHERTYIMTRDAIEEGRQIHV